jgi:preprotein translocase subunit SecG
LCRVSFTTQAQVSIGFEAAIMSESTLIIYTLFCAINILVTFISFLLFSRNSVKKINRALEKEGISLCPWDGIGLKAIWCARVIAFDGTIFSGEKDPLIDSEAVKRHATKKDKYLASVFCISCTLLVIIAIVHMFIVEPLLPTNSN